jgi:RNA 2',3'-cyclic 3'-phosphodiesterase
MPRLFVAIALPEDVRDRLGLLAGGVPGARWVDPENLHLTLRFIGEVDGGWAEDITAALGGVVARPFELALAGVGHWGTRERATAIWAGVEKNPGLSHLQSKVESALVRLGLEPEGRKFAPHVTLARLSGSPCGRVAKFIADHNLFRLPPFPVTAFTLFSSFLSRGGAIYTPEVEYALLGT